MRSPQLSGVATELALGKDQLSLDDDAGKTESRVVTTFALRAVSCPQAPSQARRPCTGAITTLLAATRSPPLELQRQRRRGAWKDVNNSPCGPLRRASAQQEANQALACRRFRIADVATHWRCQNGAV